MKSIIIFFSLMFMILGAGATYYETQIAGPKAKVAAKKQAGKRKNAKSRRWYLKLKRARVW